MKKKIVVLFLSLSLLLTGCTHHSPGAEMNKENSHQPVDPSISSPSPIDPASFSNTEKKWIHLAESFYIAHITVSQNPSEEEKAKFFLFLISTDSFRSQMEQFETASGYEIPLSYIEEVITSYLDTDTFNPSLGFPSATPYQEYDERQKIYKTTMLGGYGGAAALGVLEYKEEDCNIKITLGSYDMPQFYSDPPTYILNEKYKVEFEITDDMGDKFIVIKAGTEK